jgi:hypothetical protein
MTVGIAGEFCRKTSDKCTVFMDSVMISGKKKAYPDLPDTPLV